MKAEKHKPLILQGARQVGEHRIIKKFGTQYSENIAFFNCDEQIVLRSILSNPTMWFG